MLINFFKYWTYHLFSPCKVLREQYEGFKSLLKHDQRAHEIMAELEKIHYYQAQVDIEVIRKKYHEMSACVAGMIQDLERIRPFRYSILKTYYQRINGCIRLMLQPSVPDTFPPHILPLRQLTPETCEISGGKACNLARIKNSLHFSVPEGYVITTRAFYYFIEYNHLQKPIAECLSRLDNLRSASFLDSISQELTNLILNGRIPPDLKTAIQNATDTLQTVHPTLRLALRSSARGEDAASTFAGQFRTVLNVSPDNATRAYKKVLAGKYTPRALCYRIHSGCSDMEMPMAVLVIEMIAAQTSGIMYTENIDDSNATQLSIHAVRGVGEPLVQGRIAPDIFVLSKEKRPRIICRKRSCSNKRKLTASRRDSRIFSLETKRCDSPSIDAPTALNLAEIGLRLEKFFNTALDIEWCQDHDQRLYVLQARPLQRETDGIRAIKPHRTTISNPVLISDGEKASSGAASGKVFKIRRDSDLRDVPDNAVLVAHYAAPHYVTVLDRLSAVITDTGSTAGHFSSVAREYGVPAIVNTRRAMKTLTQGQSVTVLADEKIVVDGIVPFIQSQTSKRQADRKQTPFRRKLNYVMSFISPLKLIDPQHPDFTPDGCRSLHDIIRFVHEKAMQEMFALNEHRIRPVRKAHKLLSEIPMLFFLQDLGGGLSHDAERKKEVEVSHIRCFPLNAILRGLSDPGIHWSDFSHFDWETFDQIVMSGGIIRKDASLLGSYALISNDYLNLNLRFGYHFVIIDTLLEQYADNNYISFRFSGGGGDYKGRALRADFLKQILENLGFSVDVKGDMVDAQYKGGNPLLLAEKLEETGRLLGATRLLDMYLKDASDVKNAVDNFRNGQYDFASLRSSE